MGRGKMCAAVCVTLAALIAAPVSPAFAGSAAPATSAQPAASMHAASATPVDDVVAPVPMGSATGSYVVVLDEAPAASYAGGVSRMPATLPAPGEKLDPHSRTVRRYTAFLKERQAEVAAATGVEPMASYRITLNGFSARMSPAQAAEVAAADGVRAVYPDQIFRPDAVSAPDDSDPRTTPPSDPRTTPSTDLRTTPPTDPRTAPPAGTDTADPGVDAAAGSGVVIGVIDTGIATENPAFAGERLRRTAGAEPYLDGDTVVFDKADGHQFRSARVSADGWAESEYSTKLVGARHFAAGATAAGFSFDHDVLSPRDADGHGSHVAGIAAGNDGVAASVQDLDLGVVSGIAPAAKIAAYKACFTGADPLATADDICVGSDLLAAIEQSVADGVDIISYAVGGGAAEGGAAEWGAADIALYNAAVAGVFVAVSAGNTGPAPGTIVQPAAPWYTTVAASTGASFEATVQLSTGETAVGVSVSVTSGTELSGPVVYAGDAGARGSAEANLCYPGTLDRRKVAGTIVICDRGTNPRTEKSQEVADAGGIGMILANVTPDSLDSEVHAVPTVHVDADERAALLAALTGGRGITATLVGGNVTDTATPSPQIAPFSSRGPSLPRDDILTPDLAAPGGGVLAAGADSVDGDPTWGLVSGTSMAAAHVAGLAAAYLSASPAATPDAVKSALMTSAQDTLQPDGSANVDPFAQGAGHVDAGPALDPGLLYLSGPAQWGGFTSSRGRADPDAEAVAGRDLNLPSITIGALAGEQTVTRTLTATRPGTYTVATSIPGVQASVEPAALTFTAAGDTQEFEVTFTNLIAPSDVWATGFLTWTGEDGTTVRSPLAVRPASVDAEPVVTGEGMTGSADVSVLSAADVRAPVQVAGLAPVRLLVDADHPVPGHSGDQDSGDANGNAAWIVPVPSGSPLARFTLSRSDDRDPALTVHRLVSPTDTRYAQRWTPAPDAPGQITLTDPAEGAYLVVAHVGAGSDPMTWDLTAAVVTADAPGSLSSPQRDLPAWGAGRTQYTLTWTGLEPDTRYLGLVRYGDSPARTVVEVDAGAAPPEAKTPPAVQGDPQVGETLVVEPGTWSPDDVDRAYVWLRNGQPIPGADGRRYRVTAADVGAALSVRETASRSREVNAADAVSQERAVDAASLVEVTMNRYAGTTDDAYAVTVRVTTSLRALGVGTVEVWVDGTRFTGTLAQGTATFRLPPQKPGVHVVAVQYGGGDRVAASAGASAFFVTP